jgi:hypothetical protein
MLAQDDHDEAAPDGRLPLAMAVDLQDHLLVASNDLDRLQRLLGEAGDSLLLHFHGAAGELNGLLRAAAAGQPGVDLGPLRTALEHISGAITAMQFQDLASQLVDHTTRRLRGCADRLAAHAFAGDEDGDAFVEPMPLRPNPVTQDEMDAGSVELF